MRENVGRGADACRTLYAVAGILTLLAVTSPRAASAQARGTMAVRAQVLSAAPGQAGIDGAARLVRTRRPAPDSATRAETQLAVVTLRWEGGGGRPAERRVQEADSDRPRLVASIEFLRN
jgi:hypothetical protein